MKLKELLIRAIENEIRRLDALIQQVEKLPPESPILEAGSKEKLEQDIEKLKGWLKKQK